MILAFIKRIPVASLVVFLLAAAQQDFVKEETTWRTQREQKLTNPDGWLAVAGLFWLHEGTLSLGSDPQSDVVLPARAPKRAGALRMQKGAVTFEPAAGVNATVNGKPSDPRSSQTR